MKDWKRIARSLAIGIIRHDKNPYKFGINDSLMKLAYKTAYPKKGK